MFYNTYYYTRTENTLFKTMGTYSHLSNSAFASFASFASFAFDAKAKVDAKAKEANKATAMLTTAQGFAGEEAKVERYDCLIHRRMCSSISNTAQNKKTCDGKTKRSRHRRKSDQMPVSNKSNPWAHGTPKTKGLKPKSKGQPWGQEALKIKDVSNKPKARSWGQETSKPEFSNKPKDLPVDTPRTSAPCSNKLDQLTARRGTGKSTAVYRSNQQKRHSDEAQAVANTNRMNKMASISKKSNEHKSGLSGHIQQPARVSNKPKDELRGPGRYAQKGSSVSNKRKASTPGNKDLTKKGSNKPYEQKVLAERNSSPKNSSPKNTSPKNTSPKNSSPKNSSPQNSSPKNSSPKNSSPKNTSPKNSSPKSMGIDYQSNDYQSNQKPNLDETPQKSARASFRNEAHHQRNRPQTTVSTKKSNERTSGVDEVDRTTAGSNNPNKHKQTKQNKYIDILLKPESAANDTSSRPRSVTKRPRATNTRRLHPQDEQIMLPTGGTSNQSTTTGATNPSEGPLAFALQRRALAFVKTKVGLCKQPDVCKQLGLWGTNHKATTVEPVGASSEKLVQRQRLQQIGQKTNPQGLTHHTYKGVKKAPTAGRRLATRSERYLLPSRQAHPKRKSLTHLRFKLLHTYYKYKRPSRVRQCRNISGASRVVCFKKVLYNQVTTRGPMIYPAFNRRKQKHSYSMVVNNHRVRLGKMFSYMSQDLMSFYTGFALKAAQRSLIVGPHNATLKRRSSPYLVSHIESDTALLLTRCQLRLSLRKSRQSMNHRKPLKVHGPFLFGDTNYRHRNIVHPILQGTLSRSSYGSVLRT